MVRRTEGMEEGSEGVKQATWRRLHVEVGRSHYIIISTGQLRMNWYKTSLASESGQIYQVLPKLLSR